VELPKRQFGIRDQSHIWAFDGNSLISFFHGFGEPNKRQSSCPKVMMEQNYKKGEEKNFHLLGVLFEEFHVGFLCKNLTNLLCSES
jgi:hypothetical protein